VGRTAWSAAGRRAGLSHTRTFSRLVHYPCVIQYRRRRPHLYQIGQPVFLTWRLHGSLPQNRPFSETATNPGRAFLAMDRLLDRARSGPLYLSQPALAAMIVDSLHYRENALEHFILHAFSVMPNHVHLLVTPLVALPKVTRSLKGITAKQANQMLARTGNPFWQEESYDHLVRNQPEFDRIRSYIEQNPVRAGLVMEAVQYRWSSAGWPARRPAADQAVRPTDV